MGLMRMMFMPLKMMRHMGIMWRLMLIALGLIRMALMPCRMMKRMRMMGHPMRMKHMCGNMHMMWRSTMTMLMLAQLAMLTFVAVVIIASTVVPIVLLLVFWMMKWAKKNMRMGMPGKHMMRRRFMRQ